MTKENSNAHRKGKVHFSVYLTPMESRTVIKAIKTTKVRSKKELLLQLCEGV